MRSTAAPLTDAIKALMISWRKFIRSAAWTRTQDGAVAFLEVTRNLETGQWHPHLHVLALGRFVPQAYLQQAWSNAVGSPSILHIGKVRVIDTVLRYVVAYVTKAWHHSVLACSAATAELVAALAGQRVIIAAGSLRGKVLVREDEDAEEWDDVGSFATLLFLANNGDEAAAAIVRQIPRTSTELLLTPPPAD